MTAGLRPEQWLRGACLRLRAAPSIGNLARQRESVSPTLCDRRCGHSLPVAQYIYRE